MPDCTCKGRSATIYLDTCEVHSTLAPEARLKLREEMELVYKDLQTGAWYEKQKIELERATQLMLDATNVRIGRETAAPPEVMQAFDSLSIYAKHDVKNEGIKQRDFIKNGIATLKAFLEAPRVLEVCNRCIGWERVHAVQAARKEARLEALKEAHAIVEGYMSSDYPEDGEEIGYSVTQIARELTALIKRE